MLHVAVRLAECDKRVVIALLLAGADPDAVLSDGSTALHVAARSGRADMLESLLAHRAHPLLQCARGTTPGQDAVENGFPELARMLELAAKRLGPKGNDTAAMAAWVRSTRPDLASLPHVLPVVTETIPTPKKLAVPAATLNATEKSSAAPRTAAGQGAPSLAQALQAMQGTGKQGPQGQGGGGRVPAEEGQLFPAPAAAPEPLKHLSEILLRNPRTPHIHVEHPTEALLELSGRPDGPDILAERLVFLGARAGATDSTGATALLRAARCGNLALVRCLYKISSEEVSKPDLKRVTPFVAACAAGHLQVAEFLALELGSDCFSFPKTAHHTTLVDTVLTAPYYVATFPERPEPKAAKGVPSHGDVGHGGTAHGTAAHGGGGTGGGDAGGAGTSEPAGSGESTPHTAGSPSPGIVKSESRLAMKLEAKFNALQHAEPEDVKQARAAHEAKKEALRSLVKHVQARALLSAARAETLQPARILWLRFHADVIDVAAVDKATGDGIAHALVERAAPRETLKVALQMGVSFKEVNRRGQTPLHLAAIRDDDRIVKWLTDVAKVPVEVLDHYDITPLQAAQNAHADAAAAVLRERAASERQNSMRTGAGLTPIKVEQQHAKTIEEV